MYKRVMRPISLSLAVCLVLSPMTLAGENDFKQPIKVDSKSQFVDGKSKTSIFREDVHITQGSLSIDADEVEVIAIEGEGREVFIARGQPAVYGQTMDDGSRIKAVANEIRYQVSNSTLTLTGNAELQQNSSKVSGDSIVFNMELEQLIAQGTDDDEGRVTTIFQPDSLRSNDKKESPADPQPDDDKGSQP
ncbi:lipopolysaccharide transport periplasmic protein LptA [Aestuariibacter halophilus]|uniref:Lipopolysaccharide export system protein LptA n=1 Tax=Fluctibacter halophilus TaxID=226011 RepID=A0ABS8GB86_9ALTE|nr:lipopolysaccharide transport periplasmic protein LptA [Aestuariibacter halophilus]MCC2617849.1 lipopolysaccharide transport periplasmic protein LptA [Aestuariibacter halophilus]